MNWLMVCKKPNGVHFTKAFEEVAEAMQYMRESTEDFVLVKMYPMTEKARDYVNLVIGN